MIVSKGKTGSIVIMFNSMIVEMKEVEHKDVNIDGKTIRGSKRGEEKAVHKAKKMIDICKKVTYTMKVTMINVCFSC